MHKVLVIRFSSIGDIVLTSPVVRCLKEQINAEVHFLTKPNFEAICSSNPNIHKVHTLKEDFNQTLKELQQENFTYVVDLHNNIRSMRVKKGLNAPSKSFPKLNIEKWLLVQLKWNRMPHRHIVDRYFDTTTDLNIQNDCKGLDFFIPSNEVFDLDQLGLENTKPFVAIAIGGQHGTKQFPASKLIEVINQINMDVVLLGGPDDKGIADEIIHNCNKRIFNACGVSNLFGSASIIEQSNAVITNDTGMMHIAAAFQKTTAAIWGNTVPDFGMFPYLKDDLFENFEVNVNCRPCSKIGFKSCPKKHFKCMMEQDSSGIARYINRISS